MGTITRAITLAAAGLGGWLGYRLIMQHGRLLLRIEELEKQVAQLTGNAPTSDEHPDGLPVGSVVLDFALPTLAGGTMTLGQWRGRRVLLIFFDPQCRFCRAMLPELAALEPDPTDGRPVPLVVSTGDPAQNRRLMNEHAVRCPVLLQERDEVAQLYLAGGTPMGYLIDEHGATTGPLVVGAQALMALARAQPPAPTGGNGHAFSSPSSGYTPRPAADGPASSRIKRNGLAAGIPAPHFRLPQAGGGELALEDYRGRQVLLVFSDPLCPPCATLAPRLEQIHRRVPGVQVLMISRGTPADTRAKIAQHGLTFPVVLQRHWEISRHYGMFATPVGYLLDARGMIAKDVAVGSDAILALVAGMAHHANGHKEVRMPQ